MRNLTYPLPDKGITLPPEFPLSNINVPIVVHISKIDPATNQKDIDALRTKIPSLKYAHIVDDDDFTHKDFIVGVGAYELVYEPIVNSWRIFDSDRCSELEEEEQTIIRLGKMLYCWVLSIFRISLIFLNHFHLYSALWIEDSVSVANTLYLSLEFTT